MHKKAGVRYDMPKRSQAIPPTMIDDGNVHGNLGRSST